MKKLRIIEALKNGFMILLKHPIIFVFAMLTYLPLLFFKMETAKHIIPLIIIHSLLRAFFIGLVIRFIYEVREKSISWQTLIKFVLSKYFLLIVTFTVYFIIVAIGVVALVIPGIILGIRLALCDYGILLEGEGITKSIKRSWIITKGNWWRLFAFFLIAMIPVIIFSMGKPLFSKATYSIISFLLSLFYFSWLQSSGVFVYLQLKDNQKKEQR